MPAIQSKNLRTAPAIEPAEYDARHAAVREFLAEHELAALMVYSPQQDSKWVQNGQVGYLSGWANPERLVESVVVVPVRGEPVMLFPGLQFVVEQAGEVSVIEDMRLVAPADPNAIAGRGATKGFGGATLDILKKNGLAGGRVGVVGLSSMPVTTYRGIAGELGDQLTECEDIVAALRCIKSPAEVEAMRAAAHLSDVGFETMLRVARPGISGIELVAEMEHAARAAGADHAKYWFASGRPPDVGDVHMDIKPHYRRLEEGDLLQSCSYIVYRGYWCHGHRIGSLGKLHEQTGEIYQAANDAQDAGMKLIRPGVPIAEAGTAIGEAAAAGGLLRLDGGRIGHGIGMDYSEQPVPLNDENPRPFEPGMIFVVHATLLETKSEKLLIPRGDVCHVTADGYELMMQFPQTPFVAGG